MEKKILFLAVILLMSLVSCGHDDSDNDTGMFDNTESSSFKIPSSLVGYTMKMDVYEKIYNFNSSGSCSYSGSVGTLVGTPSYTYSKLSSKTASFCLTHEEKDGVGITKSYTYYTDNLTLTFTSKSGGTYSGKMTMKSTGSLSETKTSTVRGKFTLE